MKAEDLMIGDWIGVLIQVDDTGTEPVYGEIPRRVTHLMRGNDGIYCDGVTQFDGTEFVPIPLTEEILRNNGFIKVDYLKYDEPRVGISLLYKERSDEEEGYRVLIENRKSGIETRTTIKPVKYVHEIQHTIKDLHIDREITL